MKQYLFYISLLLLVSCQKNFDNSQQKIKIELPAYTETGANTVGFMLNDSVWTVFGKHFVNTGVGSGFRSNTFEVSAFDVTSNVLSVVASGRMTMVKNNTAIKDISAGFSFTPSMPYEKNYFLTNAYPGNFTLYDILRDKRYGPDSVKPVLLQITNFQKSDDLYWICSGHFSGVVYNQDNPTDSMVITDGRFDTKIIYK